MKLISSLFILLFSSSLFANTVFDRTVDFYQKNSHSKVLIKGEVKNLKHNIRARDNFYTFEVHDLVSDFYVKVKLFTIKRLKRVNKLECPNGKILKIKAHFIFDKKRNQLGTMFSDRRLKVLKCEDHPLDKVTENI